MIVLGIDVSKEKLDCYLSQSIEAIPKRSSQFQIANTEEGFEKLFSRLSMLNISFESVTVVLEPTNTYHVELIYWLHAQMAQICLANPKDAHYFAKSLGRDTKTDRLDCFALAQFGLTRKLHFWHPPTQNIRKLDALIRQRSRIVQDHVRIQNRLQSLPRTEMSFVGKYLEQQLELLKRLIAEINVEINVLLEEDTSLKPISRRLQTIPGIGPVISSLLIVLFSNRDFRNGEQVAAFCGIIPKEYQSGTSVNGKPRMTKRGPSYIRSSLRMAAASVLRSKKASHLKASYERLLEKGKSKASALGALMHRLVTIAFAIWRDEVDYSCA